MINVVIAIAIAIGAVFVGVIILMIGYVAGRNDAMGNIDGLNLVKGWKE